MIAVPKLDLKSLIAFWSQYVNKLNYIFFKWITVFANFFQRNFWNTFSKRFANENTLRSDLNYHLQIATTCHNQILGSNQYLQNKSQPLNMQLVNKWHIFMVHIVYELKWKQSFTITILVLFSLWFWLSVENGTSNLHL